ncbi:MAG TPA: methyltransferase domain-containing protein [Deltaproteobacteria bacterium]|nr:methyltransferase domain-containing protein [Deltaproteobacteria bacterium]HPP80290.1 methyltransferase domain-containing protein [Deltaproteobacteria bacterium]
MTYEFDGREYEKASAHQQEWGNRLISELNLTGNERILDLGCGDGKLTESLSILVPNGCVLGIDASQGMIDVAKQKEKDNLKFKLMDIDTLELHDKYDVIFSNAALHWVKDHQRLWQNLKTILSEKGIVRFNFAADGNCVHFLKIIREAITMDEYKKYFVNFEWPWYMPTIEEYKKIVEPLSFSELKIWGENADRLFPDKESIIGWINQPSIVPFLKCIEESKRDKIRNYVIDRMLQSTSQKDGYYETFRRINVYAKY